MKIAASCISDPLEITAAALNHLCRVGGLHSRDQVPLNIFGVPEQLPSAYHVGPAAVAAMAAQALAAACIWEDRSGERQTVGLEFRRVMAAFQGEQHLRLDDAPLQMHSPLTGYYEARDGRWLQLHTGFPAHRDRVLQVLGVGNDREEVAAVLRRRDADEVVETLIAAGAVAATIRSPQEWQRLPQAMALQRLPVFSIERIGDGPRWPVGGDTTARQPLSGVRVMDLSRVIAGPVAGRTLAQHGADVLAIGAAHLDNIRAFQLDTGRGKRFANLDLRMATGHAAFERLLQGADIFLQAYRPDALANRGLGATDLAARRPGIVCVDLCAYGHEGPWAQRRGYDSIVQSGSGIAWSEGRAAGTSAPGKLPCQALDHASGYIAAFAAMLALRRRAREGGSWRVRVSLAQTGQWLAAMGQHPGGKVGRPLTQTEITPWLHHMDTAYGKVSAIAPVEDMPACPPRFSCPPAPPQQSFPGWVT